jgi:hypothetical protein
VGWTSVRRRTDVSSLQHFWEALCHSYGFVHHPGSLNTFQSLSCSRVRARLSDSPLYGCAKDEVFGSIRKTGMSHAGSGEVLVLMRIGRNGFSLQIICTAENGL